MTKVTRFESLKIRDVTDILCGLRTDSLIKKNLHFDGHEKVVYAEDPSIGFKAFIAVHNTNRGYALGGCRYWSRYEDLEGDGGVNAAAVDALRLSRGMTYKNSVANLPLGGGKAVIIGKPSSRSPSAEMMRALGTVVDSLDGLYVTAEDVGTKVDYMLIASGRTPYVAGLPLDVMAGHRIPTGIISEQIPEADPSPYTAYGTYVGIKAAVKYALKADTVKDLKISVKGYGNVSSTLCDYLYRDGAQLLIADIDKDKRDVVINRYGAGSWLDNHELIMTSAADVYVPAALGADINDKTISDLTHAGVKIIAGCANNQLAEFRHGLMLRERGIRYAPDYVINSGGVIAAGLQYDWSRYKDSSSIPFPTHKDIKDRVAGIYDTLLKIFTLADTKNICTADVADLIAYEGFANKEFIDEPERRSIGV